MPVIIPKFCLVAVLLYVQIYLTTSFPSEALAVIKSKEKLVLRLAEEASSLSRRRTKLVKDCVCSPHICQGIVSQKECTDTLRKSPQLCGQNCKAKDLAGPTYIHTPPFIDTKELSSEMKENICIYRNIEPALRDIFPQPNTSTELILRDGHSRLYPAVDQESGSRKTDRKTGTCEDYDPRFTERYFGALTGPKDIVFILDSSNSMNKTLTGTNTTWWKSIRRTMPTLLSNLSAFDLVSVVTMSEESGNMANSSIMLSGTTSQIRWLGNKIRKLEPTGKSSPASAFETAFNLLINTVEARRKGRLYTSGRKVIVYIANSSRSGKGRRSTSNLLQRISQFQETLFEASEQRASIFSFSLSHDGKEAFPRQLACANEGAWFSVEPNDNLLHSLTSYNTFLGATQVSKNPVWTNPRKTKNKQGWTTTVAQAFYSQPSGRQESVFLGVVSHDVLISEITSTGGTLSQVRRILKKRSRRNIYEAPSPCLLQVYRNVYANGSICPDDLPSLQSKPVGNITASTRVREGHCFQFKDNYYLAFDGPLNWTASSEACKKEGGQLATGASPTELEYLAGLASPDGSWVGARQRTAAREFLWEVKNPSPINITTELSKGSKEDSNDGKCVLLDNRGVSSNLIAAPCFYKRSYLCVFDDQKACSKIQATPKRGYFARPSLDVCIEEEEALANAGLSSVVTNIPSGDVLCSSKLPEGKSSVCCRRCGRS